MNSRTFAVKLRRLQRRHTAAEMQQILEELFGEKPAQSVSEGIRRPGSKDVGDMAAATYRARQPFRRRWSACRRSPSSVRAAPSHKFFGDHPDDLPKRR